jgi:hypothetical protein
MRTAARCLEEWMRSKARYAADRICANVFIRRTRKVTCVLPIANLTFISDHDVIDFVTPQVTVQLASLLCGNLQMPTTILRMSRSKFDLKPMEHLGVQSAAKSRSPGTITKLLGHHGCGFGCSWQSIRVQLPGLPA